MSSNECHVFPWQRRNQQVTVKLLIFVPILDYAFELLMWSETYLHPIYSFPRQRGKFKIKYFLLMFDVPVKDFNTKIKCIFSGRRVN